MFLALFFMLYCICVDCSTSWYQTNKPLTIEEVSNVFYKCTEAVSVFNVHNDYTNVRIDVKIYNKHQIVTVDVSEPLPLLLTNKCNITLDFPKDSCIGYVQDYLYNSISGKLYHLKRNLCNSNYPIILTGNNIGGSLAYLIALDLIHSNIFVKQIVTFGAMPPGDEQITQWLCNIVKCINNKHKFDPMNFEGENNFRYSDNVIQYKSNLEIFLKNGLSRNNDHTNDKIFGYKNC